MKCAQIYDFAYVITQEWSGYGDGIEEENVEHQERIKIKDRKGRYGRQDMLQRLTDGRKLLHTVAAPSRRPREAPQTPRKPHDLCFALPCRPPTEEQTLPLRLFK
jgi:hypothetical protein